MSDDEKDSCSSAPDHNHPTPFARVHELAKGWGCGRDMVVTCHGFAAVFAAALAYSRATMTIVRSKYGKATDKNIAEIEEFLRDRTPVCALLVALAIKREDSAILDVLRKVDTHDFAGPMMPQVDLLISQACGMVSIPDELLLEAVNTPGDDLISAATADVERVCDEAKAAAEKDFIAGGAVVVSDLVSLLKAGLTPKPGRNKHDLN